MTGKHTKKCFTTLAIKEMQIKTTLRDCLFPVRVTIIKKTTNAAEDVERREPLYSVGGM
jgi:hypothetical protein